MTPTEPTCARRLEFDSGHRVLRHESKCRHVHGHRYVLELTCAAAQLDDLGRVIDFGVTRQSTDLLQWGPTTRGRDDHPYPCPTPSATNHRTASGPLNPPTNSRNVPDQPRENHQ